MVVSEYPLAERRLGNGLRVVAAPSDSPGVAVNIWYGVGSADEPLGRTGFAHLFEHVMFQGSRHVASGEHFALLEAAGGVGNATTSFDRTNYFEIVPKGALDLALWLEADRMAGLVIDQHNLDTQREVVKEEKRQSYDNQPYGDLLQLLLTQHFPADHPYGHTTIGSMADLDAASVGDVQAFFDAWYRPANAVLTLAGRITPDEAFDLADRYFGDIPGGPPELARATPTVRNAPGTLDASGDVPHDLLYLSWATPRHTDPDAETLDALFALLADGLSSRLHTRLVKRRNLAESIGASGLPLARTESISTISARLDEQQSMDDIESAILEQLAIIAATPPSDAELDRTRAQLERGYLTALASVEERADLVSESAMLYGDPHHINGYLDRLARLTPRQLSAAAERWLAPTDRYVLRYHRKEKP